MKLGDISKPGRRSLTGLFRSVPHGAGAQRREDVRRVTKNYDYHIAIKLCI